ncbi:MAG: cation:proton antiporter [Synechococcales bacterium]|nr:cation:proton antiporter [Synechococcales bacterium]
MGGGVMQVELIVQVLIQVLLVIGLSRLVGLLFRKLQQPLVIGEILAGILLGPSLLGLVAPNLAAALFPQETIPYLGVLSQIGLIFFMFLIGLELDPRDLKGEIHTAVMISHVSILLPFSLGTIAALILYPQVSSGIVSFTAFALFLGSAMSITAFPVLARIITEHNLQQSWLGTLALTCAAVDDVTAWCLLAVAIAVTRTNSMVTAIPTILAALLYIGFMLVIGRGLLQFLAKVYDRTGRLTQSVLAVIYICMVVSAIITEQIGIHLIFGAFLFGAVMPKHEGLTRELAQKTEDFVLTFLLPIFFAYSGLRTQVGLLNRPILWVLCLLVILVAIAGKYLGTFAAARSLGISHREASALGWLMNTRGLTELIVLNIGLSLGVISPLLFTMLVMMALVTTIMTAPLLEWTYPKQLIRQQSTSPSELETRTQSGSSTSPTYQILVPIANPTTQQELLKLAIALAQNDRQSAVVYPLNLIPVETDYAYESLPREVAKLISQRRQNLMELLKTLSPSLPSDLVQPIIQVSSDVARTTTELATRQAVNLILLGWHRPAFSSNRLGGRVGKILSTAPVDVAVYVDRQPQHLKRLLVPYIPNLHTELGLELALRLLSQDETRHLTILRITPDQRPCEFSYEFNQLIDQLPTSLRNRMEMPCVQTDNPIDTVIKASVNVDLTIAGASREWGLERQTLGRYTDELAVWCVSSLLITRRYSQIHSHHLTAVFSNDHFNDSSYHPSNDSFNTDSSQGLKGASDDLASSSPEVKS